MVTKNPAVVDTTVPGSTRRALDLDRVEARGSDRGSHVRLQVDGGRPLAEQTDLLTGACDAAEDRSGSTIVVLTLGAAEPGHRAWPAGVDLQAVNRWERAVRRLERLDCATIAVVPGTCGGPALDLLLACDYRIATARTRLLLPVNDGLFWPGMAMHRLAQQIGVGRARQVVLWGHELTVSQALDLGLVDECATSAEDAVDAAALLLSRIAGPDLAVRRRLLFEASQAGFDDALGVHLAACERELRRLGAADGR